MNIISKLYDVKPDHDLLSGNGNVSDTIPQISLYGRPIIVRSASTEMACITVVAFICILLIPIIAFKMAVQPKLFAYILYLSAEMDWTLLLVDILYLIGHGIRMEYIKNKYRPGY